MTRTKKPTENIGIVLGSGVTKLIELVDSYVPKCNCGELATIVSIQSETKLCDDCYKCLPLQQRKRSLSGLKLWIEIPGSENIRYATKMKKLLNQANTVSQLNLHAYHLCMEVKRFNLADLIAKMNSANSELINGIIAEIRIAGCKCPDNQWKPERMTACKIDRGFSVRCEDCQSVTDYEWKIWNPAEV